MNKFLAIALIAAVACVASALPTPNNEIEEEMSQLGLNPSNEDEVAALKEAGLEEYSDFCISTRDFIVNDLTSRGRNLAIEGFNGFFASLKDVADEVAKSNEEVIKEGSEQIKSANSPDQVRNALTSGLQTLARSGYSVVLDRLGVLKSIAVEWISKAKELTVICELLSSYEQQAQNMFNEVEQALREEGRVRNDVTFRQVAGKCVTAGRFIKSEAICSLVLAAKPKVEKLLGL